MSKATKVRKADISEYRLEAMLAEHAIPRFYWDEVKSLVYDGTWPRGRSAPSLELRRQLQDVPEGRLDGVVRSVLPDQGHQVSAQRLATPLPQGKLTGKRKASTSQCNQAGGEASTSPADSHGQGKDPCPFSLARVAPRFVLPCALAPRFPCLVHLRRL